MVNAPEVAGDAGPLLAESVGDETIFSGGAPVPIAERAPRGENELRCVGLAGAHRAHVEVANAVGERDLLSLVEHGEHGLGFTLSSDAGVDVHARGGQGRQDSQEGHHEHQFDQRKSSTHAHHLVGNIVSVETGSEALNAHIVDVENETRGRV